MRSLRSSTNKISVSHFYYSRIQRLPTFAYILISLTMAVSNMRFPAVLLSLCIASCTGPQGSKPEAPTNNSATSKNTAGMNAYVSLFEIPAHDISRAINFYQAILGIDIEKMETPGMEMGIFPYEEQLVPGIILKAEGYNPSADGVTLYLHGGDDLQVILDKIETNGGKVLIPKTLHADGNGYFALFLDSEGNKMGLSSPH